jgi:hypothetical protein
MLDPQFLSALQQFIRGYDSGSVQLGFLTLVFFGIRVIRYRIVFGHIEVASCSVLFA